MENIRLLARKLYFCVEVSIPLESLWQNESNSVLGWSAGSASCLFKYFELYNECLGSCLRREVSKRELWARFIVFLFVQLYNQKDNDFRTGTSLVDERAKPEADQGTSPPSSPRRLNQSPTLLSPARAKSIAEQLFSESGTEHVKFLKSSLPHIVGALHNASSANICKDEDIMAAFEVVLSGGSVFSSLPVSCVNSPMENTEPLVLYLQSSLSSSLPSMEPGTTCVHGVQRSTKIHILDMPSSETKEGELTDLHIAHCYNSTLYMLQPYRFCTIACSSDCTIVVGAVGGVISLETCERVKVIVCCKQLRVRNCLDCSFNLFTPLQPLLIGDNRSLEFGPYNTNYGLLLKHLSAAQLIKNGNEDDVCFSDNIWKQPRDINTTNNHHVSFKLTPPAAFYPFAIPLGDDSGSEMLCLPGKWSGIPLPEEYASSLRTRANDVNETRNFIKSVAFEQENEIAHANSTRGEVDKLEGVVQSAFRDWLVSSGQVREIADLIGLEKSQKTTTRTPTK